MLSVAVIGPKTQISISAEWQTQLKAKNLKPVKRSIMAKSQKGVFNRDREGYSVIWEAGTEGTDSVGTGGAVAGRCGASVSCQWVFGGTVS